MFSFSAAVNRQSPVPLNAPRFACTTTPCSNTISWLLANCILSTIQGLPIFSTISLFAPELIADCNASVASSGSNPHHDARASFTCPATTFLTISSFGESRSVIALCVIVTIASVIQTIVARLVHGVIFFLLVHFFIGDLWLLSLKR